MNRQVQQLYDNLIQLVANDEAFFYKDFPGRASTMRIFNYRLASYEQFLQPGALECRGIMFAVDPNTEQMKYIVSRPPEKFFNYRENPFTMDVDFSNPMQIMQKVDGSLISTYLDDGELSVKTKGSTQSTQAIAAKELLERGMDQDAWYCLARELFQLEVEGYTVNMEYVSPDNRIVIGYQNEDLVILNIRNRETGEYLPKNQVPAAFEYVHAHWVDELPVDEIPDVEDFIHRVPNMNGFEGYVVQLNNGQHVKVKTEWYLTQHRAKDSIDSPRRLFEAVLEESTDDLRALVYDDPVAIQKINDMEHKVDHIYNHVVDQVERFYEANKDLTQKEYAIKGKQELDSRVFGLAMNKFNGKTVDYKEFLRRNYKNFGISDKEPEEEE